MAIDMTQEEDIKLPKKINSNVWIKIFKYVVQYWYLLIILAVSMIITAYYDSSFVPVMNASAISAIENLPGPISDIGTLVINVQLIIGPEFSMTFWVYLAVSLIAIVIRSLSIFVTFFVTNYLEMTIMCSLRRDSFKRIQELSFSYFDKTPSGWIIARMQNDTSSISEFLSWGVIRTVWVIFELIFTLITMFQWNYKLSWIILATAPLIMIISPIFEMLLLKLSRIAREAYSNYVRWLAECINGTKTIKTMAIEDTIMEEANVVTSDIRKKYFKQGKVNSLFQPSVSLIAAIANAIVIAIGVSLYTSTDPSMVISVATLILFIGFVGQIYNPIMEFADLFAEFMATQASVEKIVSLINTKPQIVDKPEVIEKYGYLFNEKKENYEPVVGNIKFNHVKFSYLQDIEVLHDTNIEIKEGTSVAIVGETGSGKSTTVNLLCRFYEPSSGTIEIDDVNYQDRSIGWLRSNIGYVQQTPFVFRGSIKDNIKYGKLDATDEEVKEASMVVDLDSFIQTLPDKYDTVLEDGGNQLSTGQKQLISFARAVLRNPRIMVLDEATSSIDTETEAAIQSAIDIVLHGRTSIIIAHRLSTIINCDRILVMKDGSIIEDGNHQQLMAKKGYYHELYMNQFKDLTLETQISTFEEEKKVYAK